MLGFDSGFVFSTSISDSVSPTSGLHAKAGVSETGTFARVCKSTYLQDAKRKENRQFVAEQSATELCDSL